ncbi:MAG: SOS response-associated peptidase [Clostridiales bacterium]|nr:SOS response-associated peptidase [Clostridiales bacterium]
MCARYMVDIDIEGMKEIFDEIERRYPGVVMSTGEIYPSNTVPVLTKDGPAASSWGFKRYDGKGLVINARAETAEEKPMFRDAFKRQRCVVPTSGFFEWTKDKQKIKYLFELPDEQLLYMAGLYDYVENDLCMVVLTHDANESVAGVHERMPVILTGDQLTLWLNETDEARQIIEMASPPLVKKPV